MEPVAADLRSPALWLPVNLGSDRGLKVARALQGRAPHPPPVTGARVDTRTMPRRDGQQLRVLVHEPDARTRPSGALLWIHGGGMIMGVPEQSNEVCSRLARDLGIVVAAVDYRLAPEDPFPAPLDDCMDALRWLHEQAGALDVDPARVAVGGDSAGGGLAAAVAQRALDEGGPALAFQALVYPMLDDRTVLRTDHQGRGDFLWTPKANAFGWTAYLGHPPRAADAPTYAAPARRTDLGGLPPAWIGVGDLDLFYEEDLDYARRLEAAGVPCQLEVVAGMYHGADHIAAEAAATAAFRASLTAALRGAFEFSRQ
ncbi:MAG: alpha/beta hydrolase [Acidimicrobiia bacterium]|nr:alpha/beta hydrolase [Acidimicrobiia bacterium]